MKQFYEAMFAENDSVELGAILGTARKMVSKLVRNCWGPKGLGLDEALILLLGTIDFTFS